jgi:hypothetical protein
LAGRAWRAVNDEHWATGNEEAELGEKRFAAMVYLTWVISLLVPS